MMLNWSFCQLIILPHLRYSYLPESAAGGAEVTRGRDGARLSPKAPQANIKLCGPLPLCGSALKIPWGKVRGWGERGERGGNAEYAEVFLGVRCGVGVRAVFFNAERSDRAARGSIHANKRAFIGKKAERRRRREYGNGTPIIGMASLTLRLELRAARDHGRGVRHPER